MEKNFIISKDQYLEVIKAWRETKHHTASEHIIYNILRGYPSSRGFTPITNKIKLANGAQADLAEINAEREVTRYLGPNPYSHPGQSQDRLAHVAAASAFCEQQSNRFGVLFNNELCIKIYEVLK